MATVLKSVEHSFKVERCFIKIDIVDLHFHTVLGYNDTLFGRKIGIGPSDMMRKCEEGGFFVCGQPVQNIKTSGS